jgi:Flp pilus assembly protein TadG
MMRARLIEESGGVLLITSVALAALIFVVALVVDVANWKAHARHLQLQADAAALAGAHSLTGGSCDNSLVSNDVHKYGGSDVDSGGTVRTALYNDQIGGTPPARMHILINSAGYYGDAGAGDNTDPNGSPCAAKYVDVKVTETDLPWWFGAGLVRKINAHARVSLLQETSANGTLPVAIPNPLPNSAAAIFINEGATAGDGSKLVLPEGKLMLTEVGMSGPLDMWTTAVSNDISLPPATGVVIALSGRNSLSLTGTLQDICQQPLTDCYDASNDPPAIGVSYVRGYNNTPGGTAPNPPTIHSVQLFGVGCTANFSNGTCNYELAAKIDAGASFPKANQIYGANGVTMTSSADAACALVAGPGDCWHANMTAAGNSGAQTVDITWEITSGQRQIGGKLEDCKSGGGNKCTGDFGVVQRAYTAKDQTSGPIKAVSVWNCDSASCTDAAQSYTTGPHKFKVDVGIGGTLQNATSVASPLVVLRVRSQANQALDCDPGYTNLKDELANGCRPTYVPNTGSPDCSTLGTSALWATSQPWSCIAVSTGQQPNQVAAGLNKRIHGDEQANTCEPDGAFAGDPNALGHNNWWMFNPADPSGNDGFPPGDPRILNAYITTYGAFSHVNGTSGSVPVIAFGHFYVTGYTGQGGGFNNPCQTSPPSNYGGTHPDDPVPNDDPGLIVGRFIYYVDRLGGDGTVSCNPSSINACVIVMTK